MVDPNGQIASIIVPSELRSRHLSLLESARNGQWFLELWFLFDGAGRFPSDALVPTVLGERSRKRELMNGLMRGLFDLVLRKVLLREVSKRTMRVLGRIAVLPWPISLVALLAEHSLELVLT